MFREVEWNGLSQNYYNVKNIQNKEVYSGEYVAHNLDFIKGCFKKMVSYPRPFNDAVSNWFTYVDYWVEQQGLPLTDDITLPLKLLFYKTTLEEIQVKDITSIINNVSDNTDGKVDKTDNYIEFLEDSDFIIDQAHIKTNEVNAYQIVAVLFKDVTKNTGEKFPYKWFQIIYNKFATSPKIAAIKRIEEANAKGPESDIAMYSGNPFVPDFKQTRKGAGTRKRAGKKRNKRNKRKSKRKTKKHV